MKVLQTLVRIYVEDLDSALVFYENLLGIKCNLRFSYSEIGLELASVGQFLLLCGSESALKPFHDTKATLVVDSLDEFKQFLELNGAKIIRGPKVVPTGSNMTVEHSDGSVIEYVQHEHGE
jgi:predicted enzyme related to lactoylglutathione lyase